MNQDYDGIILGSGHNSLILQAYAGRAGLKTLCLERRDVAGGGLATMEDPRRPGFLHNTHSFYHRAIDQMPWYRDLDLRRRGAEYLEPELNVAVVLKSGKTLEWWTDFEKTYESFAQFSKRDADALRLWRSEFIPILRNILLPEKFSPPLPYEGRRAVLEKSAEGRRLLEVSQWSPLEFVEREFENPAIRGALLFFNGLREVDMNCRGFGHHIPELLANPHGAQMCRGGSAALARALVSAVTDSGGEIRLQTEPVRIRVEQGRAMGVETADGGFYKARHFVASGLNPQQTFLGLMGEDLPAEWRRKAEEFQYNLLAPLFALNVTLREPPCYSAAQEHPQLARAFMVILGIESSAQFTDIVQAHREGRIPPRVMWGSCPTVFDRSQAPAGFHTAFLWEKTPYRLGGDPRNWDEERDRHAARMMDAWMEYAPNLGDAVVDWFARSPLDTERTLWNMKEGDLLVGALTNGQAGYNRPFPGAGHYRGFAKGLYLCGASCYPGGNITGLPGYNCAQVVLRDLETPAPWAPPPVEF